MDALKTLGSNQHILFPLLVGICLGALSARIIMKRYGVIATFIHELAHAVTALLCLRRIERFIVTKDRGGQVFHRGDFAEPFGNDFIGLAPYTFPTFAVIAILLRPVFASSGSVPYDLMVGVTLGVHLMSFVRELQVNWSSTPFYAVGTGELSYTDIASRGFVYSFVWIVAVNLLFVGFLSYVLVSGYHGIIKWFTMVNHIMVIEAQLLWSFLFVR